MVCRRAASWPGGAPNMRRYSRLNCDGATLAATALAWVQSRPGVSSTIIGVRDADQFDANIAALDVTLSQQQVAALDEVSKPALNFPADVNRTLAPPLQFAGATVDGRAHAASPFLASSPTRY